MDIYCPKCGEPWDMDELHYMMEDDDKKVKVAGCSRTLSWKEAKDKFTKKGCEAFGSSHNKNVDTNRAEISAVAFEILGDDVDGVASMMDDAEFLGFFGEEDR